MAATKFAKRKVKVFAGKCKGFSSVVVDRKFLETMKEG